MYKLYVYIRSIMDSRTIFFEYVNKLGISDSKLKRIEDLYTVCFESSDANDWYYKDDDTNEVSNEDLQNYIDMIDDTPECNTDEMFIHLEDIIHNAGYTHFVKCRMDLMIHDYILCLGEIIDAVENGGECPKGIDELLGFLNTCRKESEYSYISLVNELCRCNKNIKDRVQPMVDDITSSIDMMDDLFDMVDTYERLGDEYDTYIDDVLEYITKHKDMFTDIYDKLVYISAYLYNIPTE